MNKPVDMVKKTLQLNDVKDVYTCHFAEYNVLTIKSSYLGTNFVYTVYDDVQTITLDDEDPVELSTPNYPGRTHADCKWILINKLAGALVLTFVDFNITFGVSLTIGSGNDFEQKSQVVKIGTPDVPVDVNDTMLLTSSTAWIWFQSYDSMAKLDDRFYSPRSSTFLRYKQHPSVSGVKLQIASAGLIKGLNCEHFGYPIKLKHLK